MNLKHLGCIALVFALASCGNQSSESGQNKGPKADILITDMDTSMSPGTDFFEYANGGWIKRNPIPADETSWGIGPLVQEELYTRKRNICEAAAAKKDRNAIEQQVANFWVTGMDSTGTDQKGMTPLQPLLTRIYAAVTRPALMTEAAALHRMGVGVLFDEGVGQDARNSEVMAYNLGQGGLGLPNRDYYFNTDERTQKIREAYPKYISRMLQLLGEKDSNKAAQRASAIVAFETKLAAASRKLEALRDPWKNYHKMSVDGLQKLAPAIDWSATIKGIGAKNIDTVIVGQPEFYSALSRAFASEPLGVLQDYFAFHLADAFAPYLSQDFVVANWDFHSKTIRGAHAMRPRWKRVLDAQERAIGEELGQLFVKEYFPEKAKERYSNLVEAIRNAYRARMEKLTWMSDSTRRKALHKLAVMKKKVGYPDRWKDFSKMQIGTASFAENMMHANEWWNDYQLAKLGKPVDRSEWDMTPQTYNAYYNPSNNEIVLPAGIFTVPGYRDEELDDALVYGYAAASTIGHEITHGFDDEGRQFDADGNLKNWWSPADSAQFAVRAAVLVRQFDSMEVLPGVHLNGSAELGENLADLGGVLLGVDAFRQTEAYKSGKKISGLMPMQRFFLGYALGWLYQIRPERLASQVLTDVHAPAKYRVNGPFPNVDAFYEAFGVKPGDKMYLPDSARVRLW